ncbi:hypothetical protein Tco_1052752 [Tanacetum coccineum]
MYLSSLDSLSPSSQSNQGYSPLNRINFDMDMENLFDTQDYYAGQGLDDDSPVEEVVHVKPNKVSKCHQKAKTTNNQESSKPWTTEEEVALCKAWCDVSKNNIRRNAMET